MIRIRNSEKSPNLNTFLVIGFKHLTLHLATIRVKVLLLHTKEKYLWSPHLPENFTKTIKNSLECKYPLKVTVLESSGRNNSFFSNQKQI